MRVTHVITRLIVGGAQENTVASVLGLGAKPDLELKLISGPTTGPEGSVESLLAPYPDLLRKLPELVRPLHPWKDIIAFSKLIREFRAHPPDLVHTHSGKAGVLGRLAACRAGVPLVIHTIHGPSFGPFQGPFANLIFRAAERRAGRVTTHFVVVADAMRRQYLCAGIGRPDQFTKIVSGFNLAPFLAARPDPVLRLRLGLSPEDFVVGKISRLFKLKGHDDLFAVAPELVRRCPRIKFLLVGDGDQRGLYEHQAASLGLAKYFVFTGLVSPYEVPALIGVMDIVVHLSRREGLPRALSQALAAARPVVAYDCDGANEICLPGATGFLIPAGDKSKLTEAILNLAGDAAQCESFGRNGQQFVRENFSVERMVDDLHALYLRLARTGNQDYRKV